MLSLPGFIWVTRLMVSVFPKKPRKRDLPQAVSILGFLLGGLLCPRWGFLPPQLWDLLGFLSKMFFARSPCFPLRGSQLKPESGTVASPSPSSPRGLPFVTCWAPASVRMAPHQGSQGEATTGEPAGIAPLCSCQSKLNPAGARVRLDKPWDSTKPGTCYNSWQNPLSWATVTRVLWLEATAAGEDAR